ncbi:LysE family translocator [Pendulispora albinea]|uniref:LysE family translocator n=1 Tax=Pendulispora albinea TaxID=2741071 RepID=A0ABZ2LYR2_9BACT
MDSTFQHIVTILPGFSLACLALAVAPGPGTALLLQRTVRDGRGAGLASVAGTEIGLFGWALASGAGLTALLRANRMLFDGMRVVGAIALVVLGVSAWRASMRRDGEQGDALPAAAPRHRSNWSAFRASLLTIAANPKAAVFAFSFFPQFLPAEGPIFVTTVWLAVIQVIVDTAWCVGVVTIADRAREWFLSSTIRRRMDRVLGTVLIALGIDLAVESR